MMITNLVDDYYSWLVSMVNEDIEFNCDDYTSVLGKLFSEKFYWVIDLDENRAADGIDLRERFCIHTGANFGLLKESMPPYCTVLEMMIALALRIENDIMANPKFGNRTSKWFWGMMKNCELANLDDENFYEEDAEEIVYSLLNRQYFRDGLGGLFCITNKSINMRNIEIWYQMNYYFNEFFEYGNE